MPWWPILWKTKIICMAKSSCSEATTRADSHKYYIILYYVKNQQDATLAVLFISNCKITLDVSDAFCVHHQEY